jgi:O-antigen/teichoic acid export membrane protein
MHTTSRVLAKLYRFGVPYQIGTIATFFLQFGDRFFLVSSRGAAAVGIYGLAYQFGFLFDQVALGPFFKAWIPRRYSEASWDRARRDASANDGLLYMTLLGVVAGVGLSLLVRPVLMVMASPPFRGAADIAPIVVLAFLIQGWSSVAQFGIDLAEQPRYVTIAAWVSAAAIFGLYELLIPR